MNLPLDVRRLLRAGWGFFLRGVMGIISVGKLCLLPLLARDRLPIELPRSIVLPLFSASELSDSIEWELERLSEATSGAMSFTDMRTADE